MVLPSQPGHRDAIAQGPSAIAHPQVEEGKMHSKLEHGESRQATFFSCLRDLDFWIYQQDHLYLKESRDRIV